MTDCGESSVASFRPKVQILSNLFNFSSNNLGDLFLHVQIRYRLLTSLFEQFSAHAYFIRLTVVKKKKNYVGSAILKHENKASSKLFFHTQNDDVELWINQRCWKSLINTWHSYANMKIRFVLYKSGGLQNERGSFKIFSKINYRIFCSVAFDIF